MANWRQINGHIATPAGFRAAALAAGIKKAKGALDLALIVSDSDDTSTAGTFTTNLASAAPVQLSKAHLAKSQGCARAIIVNSGNANAATGRAGLETARKTAKAVASLLKVPLEQVLVASTGVIGVPLQLERITRKLPGLVSELTDYDAAEVARAIMTTDTYPKCCVLRSEIAGTAVHLAGIAKGAGMIHPRMATMLSFITTDASIKPRMLQNMLAEAVEGSFNRISVDGDTSTNDTVLVLASGASGIAVRPGNRTRRWFMDGLTQLTERMAKMIARDGEGAKKLVTIEVSGARTPFDAERVARAIANSPLVKTAIAGSDPNWGRIICAAGYSGARFNPDRVDIRVNDLYLCRKGLDTGFDEASASREFDRKELTLHIHLHAGSGRARFWTCDLTHDYITINASYRT
ncbi:MAG: bifunctional glutamate N-acetyltransferase/amino-acid acetyltransferase ArgJ [Acidobacteria bacterium]|nr:bifunctional glutamate N-acetyltransferase/amino-acid acetyltransferase ArgJ [Acidobacteriota bacterium]